MKGNLNDGLDEEGLLKHNKYLETLAQNLQYRLEKNRKRARIGNVVRNS